MRDLARYSFVNAKVKALASYFLSDAEWDLLEQAEDISAAIRVLNNTFYAPALSEYQKHNNMRVLERDLTKFDILNFKRILSSITGASKAFVKIILEKYEIYKLKCALRLWKRPLEAEEELEYLIHDEILYHIDVRQIISARSFDDIISFLDKTPYKDTLLEIKPAYEDTENLFFVELSLDKYYYNRLYDLCEKLLRSDKNAAFTLLGIEIDIENINTLIRMHHYYQLPVEQIQDYLIPHGYAINIHYFRNAASAGYNQMIESLAVNPYEQLKTLSEGRVNSEKMLMLESVLGDVLYNKAKKFFRGYPFSIGVIFSYVIIKRIETEKIVSLFYSKLYKKTAKTG